MQNQETVTLLKSQINDLLSEVAALKAERDRLARMLRVSENRNQVQQFISDSQAHVNQAIEAEKQKQELYLLMMLQSIPDIIFIFDGALKLLFASDSVRELLDVPDASVLAGSALSDIVARYPRGVFAEQMAGAVLAVRADRRQVKADVIADDRRYELFALPFYSEDDTFEGILVLAHNITQLAMARIEAENASRAKSEFLANMSHEIRTPMNAILGLLTVIEQEPLSDRQREYLRNIGQAGDSLLAIINDILDFSKIEAGKMEIVPVDLDLKALLDNLYSLIFVLAKNKRLAFQMTLAPDLPEFIFADGNRIRQILCNVLMNAVKYTREGSVGFHVETDGEKLVFSVTDTGIGIKPKDAEKLFSAFEQLDLRKNNKVVGTGLGLAISKRLCEKMGGDIAVKSVYGKGSTFIVTLPFEAGEASGVLKTDTENAGLSWPDANVLVVDDVDMNLLVAEAILLGFDIQPDLAPSGAKALERVAEKRYDIIFMDQMMPEMDGIETTAKVRAVDDYYRKVPVVALTANAISGAAQTLLGLGFDDYLTKPIDLELLAVCLRKWLS